MIGQHCRVAMFNFNVQFRYQVCRFYALSFIFVHFNITISAFGASFAIFVDLEPKSSNEKLCSFVYRDLFMSLSGMKIFSFSPLNWNSLCLCSLYHVA